MSRVGYFEGTDPLLLTKLGAEGVETIPVANTWDGHGKYVNHLSKGEVNVVVGYLHKIIPAESVRTSLLYHILERLLSTCKTREIPVLIIAPGNLHDKARNMLGDAAAEVQLVSPEQLEAQIRKYL
jgi:hypothetical protein